MLEALSIRYGGMLIPADQCDYNSFRDMALLCPICRRSVYLAAGSVRASHSRKNKEGGSVAVKEATIATHFRHSPDVDRVITEDCELRSKQITPIQRAAIASAAKNQRAKILRSHFWKIVQTSLYMVDHESYVTLFDQSFEASFKDSYLDEFNRKKTKQLLIGFVASNARAPKRLLEIDEKLCELFDHLTTNSEWMDKVSDWFTVTKILEMIHGQMQLEIVREAFLFLIQPRQIEIFETLIKNAICREMVGTFRKQGIGGRPTSHINVPLTAGELDGDLMSEAFSQILSLDQAEGKNFCNLVVSSIFHLLVTINWGEQFEKLQANNGAL
jgi:hypothetical protein